MVAKSKKMKEYGMYICICHFFFVSLRLNFFVRIGARMYVYVNFEAITIDE